MEVIWTGATKQKQREIILHIAKTDPDAALELLDLFAESIRKLEKFPALGRSGRVERTRELQLHKHYFLVYEIAEDRIYILAIWHTPQQYLVHSNELTSFGVGLTNKRWENLTMRISLALLKTV